MFRRCGIGKNFETRDASFPQNGLREANEFHLEGMREDGTPVSSSSRRIEYVEVAA